MRHVYRYVRIIQILFKIKSKVILHDHFGKIDHDQHLPLLFSSVLKPDYYIGVSDKLTEWAMNKLCLPPENTFLLHNIIIRRDTGIVTTRESDFVIVGNIKQIKNQQLALDIARFTSKSINLIGKNQDADYFESIKKSIRQYDIDAIIYDDIDDVQFNLLQSGFGLCTSISESGPLVLIEYLAMGIPFLSSNTGEVAKIVKRELPEFIIEGYNVEDWIDRIQKIKSGNYTSEAIKRIYDQYFRPEEYFNKTLSIYNQICVS
jgi:glycosyltransferase involved in cell wall biosynthesis